jgi:hypothetical protein
VLDLADTRKRYNQRNNDPKKEYQRLVKNTKAKMSRVKDNWGIDLSYEIEIPSYDELSTAEEFDSFVEEMSSFTDPSNLYYQFDKNKKGVVYRKSELAEAVELNKKERENAQEFIDRFKEKEYQISGKDAGYTVGDRMMLYTKENVAGITVPPVFDIDAFETRGRLEGRLELMREKADGVFFDRSMRTMKNNFMKSIKGSFNSVADDILEMLDIMPEDDFFELFVQSAEFTFEDYASDGSIDGTEEQAERLRGYLHEYFKGNIDMDMKVFGTLTGGVDEYTYRANQSNKKPARKRRRK